MKNAIQLWNLPLALLSALKRQESWDNQGLLEQQMEQQVQ